MRVKQKPHHRYSRSSTLDLLIHLYETYVVILNADCLANDKRFYKAYSPTVPLRSPNDKLTTR